MFSSLFSYIQQDLKLLWIAPVVSALFRAIFIYWYGPYKSLAGMERKLISCFRFGFWWGMDFHAYVFLFLFLLVSLPASFLEAADGTAEWVKTVLLDIYLAVLYTAFAAKMIFYFHFHDTFNQTVWLGKNAEKENLKDIFFHQHRGVWILLGYIPYLAVCTGVIQWLLHTPSFAYPDFSVGWLAYAFNTFLIVGSGLFFYFLRYGGTLNHRNKPEWDTIPLEVKADAFLAKAAVDDLVALENVWKHPLTENLKRSDEEYWASIEKITGKEISWEEESGLFQAFKRTAMGSPFSKQPKHVFLIVGESYAQNMLDDIYDVLHVTEGGKEFLAQPGVWKLDHFLPAGVTSRPSICGLVSGIYDARLEINERAPFWNGALPMALAVQLKQLGYRTAYWYGGNTGNGNYTHFCPGQGFDEVYSATEFCPPGSPQTWVGIYDHVFLENAAKHIIESDDDKPAFHFVYTTSNHGPYTIPIEKYGFDTEQVMPDAPDDVKREKELQKGLGTHWYSDQALFAFVRKIQEQYEDALIVITGDHSHFPGDLPKTSLLNRDYTIRESACTSFMMYQKELKPEWFAGNTIGSHMHIMPTLMELLAPAGFAYYSIVPSLREKIEEVVTPYHWLTTERIGCMGELRAQSLEVSKDPVETELMEENPYQQISEGWCDLTGYIVRHEELLRPAKKEREQTS